MKLSLPNVTLLGIDCVNIERLLAAMDVCVKDIEFGKVKALTSLETDDLRAVEIPPIESIEDFSRFCIEDLHEYVDTDFVLTVQYDGFILNPTSWTDDFLSYDYVGAPWLVADWSVNLFSFPKELLGKKIVGNGGFSLRSKKYLETSSRLAKQGKFPKTHPEDTALCVWYRDIMEKAGIKFAPVELAQNFSVEGEAWTYANQFGFHGFGWTDISAWIARHPEYKLITKEYLAAREKRRIRQEARAKK